MERFDIVSLIRGVLGSMHIMIEQKEATVIFEETEPVYVWADEFKIEEVDDQLYKQCTEPSGRRTKSRN